MGPQKETFCIFILLSVVALSAGIPTIVKDYAPFKPSVAHKFEKRADGKYYLKEEKLDSRKSTVEYVMPNTTEQVSDKRINNQDAQLATTGAEEKNLIFDKTLSSGAIKERDEFSKTLSSAEQGKVDLAHPKEGKSLVRAETVTKDSKKDELIANIDGFQKAKDLRITEEQDTKYRIGEKKSKGEHEARDTTLEKKNLETGISISSTPHEQSAIAQDEESTAHKDIAFGDDLAFPPIPLMMSILPLLLPLVYPSRNNIPLLPLPPALHISDRLPLPDDGESKNMETPKEFVPNAEASKVAQDMVSTILQKMAVKQLYGPTPLPSLQVTSKATKDLDKIDSDENPKVFDVMGKKYIMKSKTQEHPINGMGRFFIRFMSLRPLELDVPSQTKKNFEEEKSTEVKYREPIGYNPNQHNVRKDSDLETREVTSGTVFIPKEATLKISTSKDTLDTAAKEIKTLEPIVMRRKQPEDLVLFKIDEPMTKVPKVSKVEIFGSGNIKKDLSHVQVDDNKENVPQVEGQINTSSPSHSNSTQDGPLEKSSLQTEVKPSPIPVEGDVKAYDISISERQDNGREMKALNISDKNELLEFRIVTIGYGDEDSATKDAALSRTNKAESSAETPKLHDKDMLIKEKKQSEGIDEEHKIKKEKEGMFMIPEKKKDLRKKVTVESNENMKNIKREEKYKSHKDKHSDDETEDDD